MLLIHCIYLIIRSKFELSYDVFYCSGMQEFSNSSYSRAQYCLYLGQDFLSDRNLDSFLASFGLQVLKSYCSPNRFSSVTERFFMELNTRRIDTSVARSETLSIINGMRYLKLGVRNYAFLMKSAGSLEHIILTVFYLSGEDRGWAQCISFLCGKS